MAGIGKEYEMLFKLNAQVGGSYSAAFTKAQAQITSMQKEIQSLSQHQADIKAYQKQQSAIEATRKKLETLQQQYDNIQKEIGETEGFSSDLENRLLSKKQAIEKANAALDQQTQKAQQIGAALQNAGVDTKNLAGETDRLTAEIQELKAEQQGVVDSAEEMGNSGIAAIEAYQQSLIASGIQDALKTIFEEMRACADASIEFESAATGVYKTVDGSASELLAITDAIKQLSTEIPATTEEIAAVAEAAGQLGIATADVMGFTEVMINLGESTNLSAEEAASSLAKFANITGTAAGDYSRLGSVIVDLGNNFATTEADIVAMATRLASAGTLAGLTESEIMALAAAMSSVGIESEAGGTAMTQTMSEIETAVASGSDSLDEFARIAGMSAEDFVAAWETSPIVALESFIAGLRSLEDQGESATLVLDELGLSGVRQSDTLKRLGLAADTLAGAVGTANTAWSENVALTEEAAKRYATTESQQAMMLNAFNNLKVAIGENYTPALQKLYSAETDVLIGITDFVEANPELVKAVSAAIGVVAAAATGVAGYTAVVKLGAAANQLFSSTLPGMGVIKTIAGVTLAAAALTGTVVGLSSAADEEAAAVREMTEASRAEYFQLQSIQAEYDALCEQGEATSNQARLLAWQIDELNASFEANKQTLSEYIDACRAADDSLVAMLETNRSAYDEVGTNESTTLALVIRLQELAAQTNQTVEAEEEMKAIIAELNERVPELAINFEDIAGGVSDYAAAIESTVQAQAEMQKYEAAQQGSVDAYIAKEQAADDLTERLMQQAAAQDRYNAAFQAYQNLLNQNAAAGVDNTWSFLSNEYKELVAAEEAYKTYTAQVEETRGILDQATSDYEEYKNAMVGYVEETANASTTTAELNTAINATMAEVQALSEAYTEAYNAALESVQGQYAIWDQAAEVVATGADTINTALDSQVSYWQDYNTNLQALGERSKDIEGLGNMIASFADGSTDSVNAVAGMASATDEELAAMVADWQTLQAEQKMVADSIAELNENFSAEVDAMAAALAEDVEAMNLSEEAASSGRNTIQGFVDGANAMLPQVQAAYARIAQAATAALGGGSVSGPDIGGYATGTTNAERGFAMVGENGPELVFFQGGEQVLTAAETAALQTRLQATYLNVEANATEARYSGTGGSTTEVNVNINVEGNATEQTVEALNEYGDEFVDRVRVALAEIEYDNLRRRY